MSASRESRGLRNVSIRTKFAGMASVLVVGMSLFIALYVPRQLERQALAAVTEKGESVANMLAFSLAAAIIFDDRIGIADRVDEARRMPDLAYLVIHNAEGVMRAEHGVERARDASFDSAVGRVLTPSGYDLFRVQTPISSGERRVGSLYLGLSLDAVVATTRATQRGIIILSLVLLMVGITLAVGVGHMVTRPLSDLTGTAQAIAEGNLGLRAEGEGRDEVGTLSRAFNQMVARLQARTAELEEEVRVRTGTEAELRARHSQQRVMAELGSRALMTGDNTASLMQRASDRITETLYVDECEVVELTADGALALVRAGTGLPNAGEDGAHSIGQLSRADLTDVVPSWTVTHRDLQAVLHPGPLKRMKERGVRGCLVVPIPGRQGVAGSISVGTRQQRLFGPAEEGFLTTVANLLGEALRRHEAEGALRRSVARQRTLVQALPDLILRVDDLGRLADIHGLEDFSLPLSATVGDGLHDALPPAAQKLAPLARRAIETNLPGDFEFGSAVDGAERSYEARVHPVADGEALVLIRDVTDRNDAEQERRDLEDRLRHSEKLRSLGVLAGGIAHDFNNLLMGVKFNAGLLQESIEEDSSLRATVDEIATTGDRLADLTNQMLAYSGKGRFVIEPVDLNAMILELSRLLSASIAKKIDLITELDHGLLPVNGDVAQLRQVVMNLVINAADAIGEGQGKIRVRTAMMVISEPWVGSSEAVSLGAGRYVHLEVEDDGCGMADETLGRIFEPFYSTKAKGRGLGLGAAQGIVRSHGGVLDVESTPDVGTTFTMLLPAKEVAKDAEQADVEIPPPFQEPIAEPSRAGTNVDASGEGTILVVDDEEMVRRLTTRMLERYGYEVLTAVDGAEGLEEFRRRQKDIRLVLLDLTMPRMSGDEVYQAIQELAPGTPVVFSSGFSESEALHRVGDEDWVDFIQKPYQPHELHEKVVRLLQGAQVPTA